MSRLVVLFILCHLLMMQSLCNNYHDYADSDNEVIDSKIFKPAVSAQQNRLENSVIKSEIEGLITNFRKIIMKMKYAKRLEIIFLIDSSSSVGKDNFNDEINFVKRLLSDFNVSYNYTRVAIITFSSVGKIFVHVNQITDPLIENDKCTLMNFEIPKIAFTGGGTYTFGAFLEAQKIFANSKRSDSKKVIFLVTDGFSNGQNPVEIAQKLKDDNIIIFSFGISSGNFDELQSISSKPLDSYFYMLDSFSSFEKMARKALHADYKSGETFPIGNQSYCNILCQEERNNVTSLDSNESCCDENAECTCGHYSGHYSCKCRKGYYGSGLKGSCETCPERFYWNDWNSCLECPDVHHETPVVPALNITGCVCKKGFKANEEGNCDASKCPVMKPPENGYFVKHSSTSGCEQILNTACGARCKTGYQLLGTSIRMCQEDGTWSGNETKCVLRFCKSLRLPFHGSTVCTNDDMDFMYDYSPRNLTFMKDYDPTKELFTEPMPIDTECKFSCPPGYYMVGSKIRNCLPLGKWDGLVTSCKPILCKQFNPVPYMIYDPPECASQKSPFGKNCSFSCEFGFELKGPAMKTCGGKKNGIWSQKNKSPKCVDVTPPNLVCPDNYTLEIDVKLDHVLLTELNILPPRLVQDNSNKNVTYWIKPSIKQDGVKLFKGVHKFSYIAVDDFKNKAKCNFTISVVDTIPPVVENCITEQLIYIRSKINKDVLIEWEEPFAWDNVDDKNLTVLKNYEFGYLNEGDYKINYTAIDSSSNTNKCLIDLKVKVKKCDNVEVPQNGQSLCAVNQTHTWCDIRCNFGYGLVESETNRMLENMVVYCDNENRTWNIEDLPECTMIEQPNSVEEILSITLDSEYMHCEDFTAERQEEILKNLKEELCAGEECDLVSDLPGCEESEEIPNEISLDGSYYKVVSKRDVNTYPGGIKISKQRPKNMVKINLYITISKKLGMWRQNGTRSENIKNVKEELKGINTNERLRKRLRNMNLDLSYLKLDEQIKCNNGSIVKNLACVQCPRGTYHDLKKNSCISCPFGSYQSKPGQSECIKCEDFHSTRKSNSKFASDCKKTCPPGTISRIKIPKSKKVNEKLKTLMPFCKSCPIGEYNDLHDQLECQKCPIGFTSRRGSSSIKDCTAIYEKPLCQPNPCGENGECVETGRFYYCNCNAGYVGSHCEYRPDICLSDPCNGGVCKYHNSSSAYCDCPPNYHGPNCELYSDPCQSVVCANGGICEEIAGQALCECLSGYGGEKCETKLSDYCHNNPCVTGTCVSDSNGYNCVCPAGTIGRRCHLAPCDYSPCSENSVCENLLTFPTTKDSFKCTCIKGYKGLQCDEIDSPCDNEPCRNNARCVPKLLRNMTIPGTDYDDDDVFEQFKCICPPFFYGERCEQFTTPDFIMEFEKSGINNYVKMLGPSDDLSELSFCSWIQTKDTFNYGSLISYATTKLDNAFTFTDYNGFVLYINGDNIMTDIKIIDDVWHFICVSWSTEDGFYEIFLDGELNTHGFNLSTASPVPKNGVFIIGQEQDVLSGGFSETESFVGKIAYMDFWSRTLSAAEVHEFYRTCEPYQGNLFSWTDMKFNIHGNVKISGSDFCKNCAQNLTLTNGLVSYAENEAFFKCTEGYNLVGNPKVFCLRTSQWERNVPYCKLIRCGTPVIPANGRAIISKTSYGGKVKFFCDDGFLLIGSDSAICTLNGTWSFGSPLCKSIIQCEKLMPPENGEIIYASDFGIITEELNSYPIGTFAEVKCNHGYQSDTDNLVNCLENGSWDAKIEDCMEILTTPEETTTTESTTTTTEVTTTTEATTTTTTTTTTMKIPEINFIVDKEFYKNFQAFLFYGCSPKNPEDASILCDRYLSSLEELSGFELPETDEFRSMDSKLLSFLNRVVESGDLENINVENFLPTLFHGSNGDGEKLSEVEEKAHRFVINLYLSLILMDENLGRTSTGENTNSKIKRNLKKILEVIQKKDEEDELLQEISESLGLPSRPKPMNAIQALIHSKYGESEIIVEVRETTTESPPEIACKTEEMLPNSESVEIHSVMNERRNIINIDVSSVKQMKIGSIVVYKCAKNYRMLKSMSSVCLSDGNWSKFENTCELITCPGPKDTSVQKYTVGEKIKINCKEGFVVLGNPFIYCTQEGKWTKINAKCTRRPCEKPKLTGNAVIVSGNSQSFLYRDRVTISCNSKLIQTECKSNGLWEPNPITICS